jgi:hypothetical protein
MKMKTNKKLRNKKLKRILRRARMKMIRNQLHYQR